MSASIRMSELQRRTVKRVLWEVFNTPDPQEQGIARRTCTSGYEIRAVFRFIDALDGPSIARYNDEQDAA